VSESFFFATFPERFKKRSQCLLGKIIENAELAAWILHVVIYISVTGEMHEDSAGYGDFLNLALCVCGSAENINASEDELAHIQVSIITEPTYVFSV